MNRTVATLHQVTKSFGRQRALNGVDLTLQRGEIVGLLGPNGSGKTTTLRVLAGLLNPDNGQAELFPDADVTGNAEPENGRTPDPRLSIGYLPELPPLYDTLTVRHYLEFVAAAKKLPRSQRDAAIANVVTAFQLESVVGKMVGRLSKGFRQRVGLAQAWIGNPSLLLLDEATNGLDPMQTIEARRMIKNGAKGRAILFSSHILAEIAALCTRVLILRDGRIVADEILSPQKTQPDAGSDVRELEALFLESYARSDVDTSSGTNS